MNPVFFYRRASTPEMTGREVSVAVVDSGINPHHSHVGQIAGGVALQYDGEGGVVWGNEFRDFLGHGTAVAAVIRAKAPGVKLHAVKVFATHLRTHSVVLAAALRWCADNNIRVVNLSLGTDASPNRDLLHQACTYTAERGVVLVAAGSGGTEDIYPAQFDNVLGVAGDVRCGWEDYAYLPDERIGFRAHPWPRPLPGRHPRNNLCGHSFAAAHVSAWVACIVEQHPASDTTEVRRILIEQCSARSHAPGYSR